MDQNEMGWFVEKTSMLIEKSRKFKDVTIFIHIYIYIRISEYLSFQFRFANNFQGIFITSSPKIIELMIK